MPADVRWPAVAGKFYPSNPDALRRDLGKYLTSEGVETSPRRYLNATGCVVPHAGYMYSAHVAGAVYRRLPPRSRYVILCPNHTGRGAPLAIVSRGEWRTPLGGVRIDSELAARLAEIEPSLTEDSIAHRDEHSLEVQLPFLQQLAPGFRFVPIAIGRGDYEGLVALGRAVGRAIAELQEPVLIVASSDMNHYEPDEITRKKDRLAIEEILKLDPEGLYDVIAREDITMCGFGPAIVMLTAAKALGAHRADLVKYATSADTSGDRSAVVGYAGIIVSGK